MTKRRIRLHRLAQKSLDSFPAKHRKQIAQRLVALVDDPRPADSAKLKGEAELYRLDVGEYRVIYGFDQNTIDISIIDKRNDGAAYRKLARR